MIWKWFMQITLIFKRNFVHLASFWKWGLLELGSGLLLYVLQESGTHANARQVESLITVFSHAERHEHSFISATGIKSRMDLAQTAGKDRRNRDQVDSRVCASTLLWTAYINGVMPFYFKPIQAMPCANPKRPFGWLSTSKECFFLIKCAWKCASLWFVG